MDKNIFVPREAALLAGADEKLLEATTKLCELLKDSRDFIGAIGTEKFGLQKMAQFVAFPQAVLMVLEELGEEGMQKLAENVKNLLSQEDMQWLEEFKTSWSVMSKRIRSQSEPRP